MKKNKELCKKGQISLEYYLAFGACLTAKEYLSFIEFVKAPIHGVKEDVVGLAIFLDPRVKNNKSTLIDDPSLIRRFSSVRGTQSITPHLNSLVQKLNILLELVERFIAYNQLLTDKPLRQRALVKGLKERDSNGLFLKAASDFRSSLNKAQLSVVVAEDKYWLERECYFRKQTDHVTDPEVFDRNIKAFELFNQLATLKNYLAILNRKIEDTQRAKQYDLTFNAIVEQVEQQTTYPVLIKLYIAIINILKTNYELPSPFYAAFKTSFYAAEHELTRTDQFILVKSCINHLIHVYHQLDEPWLKEMFEWMKYLSEKMLYSVEGAISDGEYLNFYVVALALDEMDVLADFEQKYSKYLSKEVKAQVLNLCESYSLQRQQKIDEALKLLEDTFPPNTKKHLKYDIRAKELKVMLCYENVLAKKGEGTTIDDLERNIENLKKYCKRLLRDDFLTEQTAAPHRNFHRVAAKFYLIQGKDTFDEKKALIKKIQKLLIQKEPISNRTWIKKQLALLEEKK